MIDFNPLVSIIIPTFNRAILITDTLQSVQDQTYQNWECIVVDDGSTDGSNELVEKLSRSEKRIKLFNRNRQLKGAPVCRNIGIEKSKGKFIIFLDSDDLMAEDCVERRVASFKKFPNEDYLVFQSLLFEKKPRDLNILWNIDSEENDLQRFLRIDALWPICGPIYKKEVLLEINGFREQLPFWQDFDLHLRFILLKYKYRKLLDVPPDCFVRKHFNESISRSIPFISDTNILQKRIDFYFSLLEFINKNKIRLNASERKTLWSVLFYFSTCFLFEHDSKKKYLSNWTKTGKLLHTNIFSHFISFIYPFLIYYQRSSRYRIKMKYIYFTIFKKYMADLNITENSTLCSVSI